LIELHSCMYIARFATVKYMSMYTPSEFLIGFKRTFESLVLPLSNRWKRTKRKIKHIFDNNQFD